MKYFIRWGRLLLLIITMLGFSSWGFLVHKTIHQLAVYQLPATMTPFFYNNLNQLVYDAPRADIRRNTDTTEATKHFIDLEAYGPKAAYKMPIHWEDAVRIYSKDSLLKYGYLPYQVIFTKDRLTAAFHSKNKDSILFYAADLGHYIADAHVPLHTTLNYDGQLTNQKGIHSLWESMIPELEIETFNLYSNHKARYLNKPAIAIWKVIRNTNELLPNVLAKEKWVSIQFTDAQKYRVQMRRGKEVKSYSTAFAKAYALSLKNTINKQLLHSAELIADFWYTSWIDAGSPDLSSIVNWDSTKAAAYHVDIDLYKTNQLLKQNRLLAKKEKSNVVQ